MIVSVSSNWGLASASNDAVILGRLLGSELNMPFKQPSKLVAGFDGVS